MNAITKNVVRRIQNETLAKQELENLKRWNARLRSLEDEELTFIEATYSERSYTELLAICTAERNRRAQGIALLETLHEQAFHDQSALALNMVQYFQTLHAYLDANKAYFIKLQNFIHRHA